MQRFSSSTRIFRKRRFVTQPAVYTSLLFLGLSATYLFFTPSVADISATDAKVSTNTLTMAPTDYQPHPLSSIMATTTTPTTITPSLALAVSTHAAPRLFNQGAHFAKAEMLPESAPQLSPVAYAPKYTLNAKNSGAILPRRKMITTTAVLLPRKKYTTPTTMAMVTQNDTATLSNKITSLQTGISSILKASSEKLMDKKKLSIGKGDTLMALLVKNDVPRTEAYQAIEALRKVYDPRDLNPKHAITVFFRQDPSVADPSFKSLRIEKDKINAVFVQRNDEGHYTVGQEEKQVRRVLKRASGTINNSLYLSAKAQGTPDAIIIDLIKMYSWNVDFQRDIQNGDTFEVMYEEYMTEDNELAYRGDVIYAKLGLSGEMLPFYMFKDSTGDTNYYDDNGHSAKKALMKTPINGARISSGYGRRHHPILGYGKMHKGVDFAAPTGTPIYAAGDGVIKRANRFSSYGNYVRIRHNNGIETAYAHMKGFKKGLHAGSRVKQGDIIGYVGTTGRSTGPHLHYEVLQNGKQVNPNSLKMSTGKALAKKEMTLFKSRMANLDDQFEDLGEGRAIVSQLTLPSQMAQK